MSSVRAANCARAASRSGLVVGLTLLGLDFFGFHPAAAQTPRVVEALRIEAEIEVDGDLSDPAWLEARPATGFTQREPTEGQPATEKTEFRVAYTASVLYISIVAWDSQPEAIVAREMERDSLLYRDDSVVVVLDTFGDQRNGYVFETNANGARFDALITDEGRDVNVEWDGVWRVGTRRSDQGWSAEFAIPFSTLRFDPGLETWGINVRRMIRRKSEEVNWAPLGFDDGDPADRTRYAVYRVSLAGRLVGLRDIRPSRQIDIRPFVVSEVVESPGVGRPERESNTEVGLDVKWGMTRNLALDLTYNTDFAEAEVDQQQVNLTRFSLFFPEKRDFFLENAGIFEFGLPQRDARSPLLMKTFFSRRIGLDEGRQVPIDYGARLTGRAAGWNIGVLDVVTQAYNFDDGSSVAQTNFGVVRVKRNLGRRSGIGMIYSDRSESGQARNRVMGVDFDYKPTRSFDVAGFWSKTDDDRSSGDNWAGGYSLGYRKKTLEASVEHVRVNEGFRPEIGFLLRQDFERFRPRVRWRPYVRHWGIRSWYFESDFDYFARASTGELESRRSSFSFIGMRTFSDDGFGLNWDINTERLFEPFEIQPGVVIPAGTYDFSNWRIGGGSGEGRKASVRGRVSGGDFFGGSRYFLNLTLRLRASRFVRSETIFDYNDVELPEGDFTTRVFGQRLGFSFTPDMRLNMLLQFSEAAEVVAANLRFNWIYRPGSDLFIVYNQNWDAPTFSARETRGRQLIVKFTHLFQG